MSRKKYFESRRGCECDEKSRACQSADSGSARRGRKQNSCVSEDTIGIQRRYTRRFSSKNIGGRTGSDYHSFADETRDVTSTGALGSDEACGRNRDGEWHAYDR